MSVTEPAPGDSHILGPGLLPTPFDPAELRAGCPDGRRIHMRLEAEGKVVGWRTNEFSATGPEGATLASRDFDADGRPTEDWTSVRVTWRELQGHASFDASITTRTVETIETELGTLECWRYTRDRDGVTSDFWFAMDIPGMPIRYRTVKGTRVTSEVTVVENELPPR